MRLEFTSNGPVGDGELFIDLDLEGLHTLMKAIESALADGRKQLSWETCGKSPNAFGKVTVTFAEPASARAGDGKAPARIP